MKFDRFMRAVLLGFAVSASAGAAVQAQNLTVLSGENASTLAVPMNRAVVVESDTPFAELSIANPAIADISTLSDKTIYVLGRAPGRTTLTLLGPDGGLISNVEVQVTPDVAEFKERLRQILPGEAIEVRTANDGIVLSGTVTSIQALDRALDLANRYAPDRVSNLMMVGGQQQVMLKVRFAEMSRTAAKGLGSNLLASYSNGSTTIDGDLGPLLGTTTGSINAIFDIGDVAVDLLLEAFESKGLVRTLAEPNLVTLSGQQARFLAGGEYPIPVSSNDGIAIEYKPFGLELIFTPRVINGSLINLELAATKSGINSDVEIGASGFTINGFSTRTAQTTVEMRDGESFAIAGLLEDNFNDSISQVPWLGDIPVIGSLFRSTQYQRDQSELVVIITPHLVSPVRGEALSLPTDRIRLPTENELFLFGATGVKKGTPSKGGAGEVAKQDFSGSYGYVME